MELHHSDPEITDDGDKLEFSGAYASFYMLSTYIYSEPMYVFQKLIRKSSLSAENLYSMTLSVEQLAEGEGKSVHLIDAPRSFSLGGLDKTELMEAFITLVSNLGQYGFNAIGFLPGTVLSVEAEGGADV